MTIDNPKITVLMPVYNGEKYLREAIESILNQTFTNFEFLIINDGSTDRSEEIIKSYGDPRIRLVNNEQNLKLIATLNKGIDLARGEYIARMDADDISLPERLEKQVRFMDTNPDVGVSGTWVKTIGRNKESVWKYPTDDATIRSRLLFESVLAHPSVMIRRRIFADNNGFYYDKAYAHVEDYELWTRIAKKCLLSNIGESLVLRRVHVNSIGQTYTKEQIEGAKRIRYNQLRELKILPTAGDLELHQSISTGVPPLSKENLKDCEDWLSRLIRANQDVSVYPEPSFSKVISERWLRLCIAFSRFGLSSWKEYWASPLHMNIKLNFRQKFGFYKRCLLKK